MALDNSYLFPFITRVHYSIIVLVKFGARAGRGAGEERQGENGKTFQVNEARENYDASVHGHTFFCY